LETAFSLSVMYSGLAVEEIVDKLTVQARRILRLPTQNIQEGQVANLTFFETDSEWSFDKSYSKSRNTPFLGKTLKGKVRGVVNNSKFEWFK